MNIRKSGKKTNNNINIDEFIENLHDIDKNNNQFQFHQCFDRNIILIGRSRTGKTTISNVVNDITYVSTAHELYSQTQTIQFKTIATDTKDNIWYYFNFIDVPGFFDMSITGKQKLSNDKINSYLQECMGKNITNIHMFAFVFNLAAGINERDIETMLYVKHVYPNLAPYMALVITHCEQLEEEQRDKLIENFFQHSKVKQSQLKEYFKAGILFMGCLRHESVITANEQSMYFEYNNILEMRTKFIEKCISREKPFNFYEGTNGKCPIQ